MGIPQFLGLPLAKRRFPGVPRWAPMTPKCITVWFSAVASDPTFSWPRVCSECTQKSTMQLECVLTSTAFRSHKRAPAQTEKKRKRQVLLFIYWVYVEKACSKRPRQWKRKPEKCRKHPECGLTLPKLARCSREDSKQPLFSLSCCLQHS